MSVEFESLMVSGFMPFAKGYTINLRNRGVVFIVGENKLSRMADSNGAGKTALLDAISWVLYDKILRGTEGVRIINTKCKKAIVELIFWIGKHRYLVHRSQEGRKRAWDLFSLKGEKRQHEGSGDQIATLFGLSFKAFTNSLMFGADMDRFSQLSDGPRKQIFDDLIDTAFFSDKRKLVDAELKVLEETMGALNLQWQTLHDTWETRDQERRELKEQLDAIEVDSLRAWLSDQAWMLDALTILDELYMDLKRWRSLNGFFNRKLRETADMYDVARMIKQKLQVIEHDLAKLLKAKKDALHAEVCSLCRRPVREQDRKVIEATYNREMDPIIDRARRLTQYLHDTVMSADRQFEQASEIIDNVPMDEIRLEMRRHLGDLQTLEHVTPVESSSRLGTLLRDLEMRLDETKIKLQEAERQKTESEREIALRRFWMDGFGHKGLKALLLRDYEQFINDRLARYAGILTLDEISLSFQAQRELKSGDMREEITFEAYNRYGAECYADMSSGEKQRIDLCWVLAVQDLIRELHQSRFSIALYDEIFEHFDETGCEAVMDFLIQQRRDFGSVFVISHNPKLLGYPSDGIIKVIKTKDGSCIYDQ